MKLRIYSDDELVRVFGTRMYGCEAPKEILFDLDDYVENSQIVETSIGEKRVLRGSLLAFLLNRNYNSGKYDYEYMVASKLGAIAGRQFKKSGKRCFSIKHSNDFFGYMQWNVKKRWCDDFRRGFFKETGTGLDYFKDEWYDKDIRIDLSKENELRAIYVGNADPDTRKSCFEFFKDLSDIEIAYLN